MSNNVEFAFFVAKQADGRYTIGTADEIEASRQPTMDDIYGALKVIEKDMIAQQTVAMIKSGLVEAQMQQHPNGAPVNRVAPTQKFKKIKREETVS